MKKFPLVFAVFAFTFTFTLVLVSGSQLPNSSPENLTPREQFEERLQKLMENPKVRLYENPKYPERTQIYDQMIAAEEYSKLNQMISLWILKDQHEVRIDIMLQNIVVLLESHRIENDRKVDAECSTSCVIS